MILKLKLTAKIKKIASDIEEGLAVFYTMDHDKKFKSAAEAYEYYLDEDNWPKGWDDDIEEDYINGGAPLKVKLIDRDDPNARGYEVTIRLVKDAGDEWADADLDIYKIETYIPKK